MTERFNELEAAVLSDVARALLDQVITFGYATDIAADQQAKLSFQQAKVSRAHLLHDVGAHMWRLGMPGIDQSTSVAKDRFNDLLAIARDHDLAPFRAIKAKEAELEARLRGAVANDQLSASLRNFLKTVLSRSETVRDDIDDLIRLDASRASELGPVEPSTAPAIRGDQPLHILLVEDNPAVAAVTVDMLQYLGWRVTRTADSAGALAALSDDIDLLFSDVVMPGGMDGLQLAQEARLRRSGLPIVLSSGYVERVKRQAEEAGIPLLPKPYGLDALAGALEAARPR